MDFFRQTIAVSLRLCVSASPYHCVPVSPRRSLAVSPRLRVSASVLLHRFSFEEINPGGLLRHVNGGDEFQGFEIDDFNRARLGADAFN
jgi:hypothetical protein